MLDNAPGVPTFSSPATLTLQYREEDLAITPGGIESLFRIYQVLDPATAALAGKDDSSIRRLGSGQSVQLVSGAQTIDTTNNTVTVKIDDLDPQDSGDTPGVFASCRRMATQPRSSVTNSSIRRSR